MQNSYKLVISFLYTFIFLLASGCTLSPQTIRINPTLDASSLKKVSPSKIWIEVKDLRKDNVVGFRGGVYDTAAISTDPNVTEAIYREVKNAFSEMGFAVVDQAETNTNKLIIEIEQLKYKTTEKKIVWGTELFASIKASADTALKKSSVTLQDKRTKDYAKFPSIEQNEEMINKLVSSLLQRLLEDQTFIEQLRN